MAIHALWEDRYGLSIRKGPLDISSFSGAAFASHDNDGADNDAHTGVLKHFNNEATQNPTTGIEAGTIIPQRIAAGAGAAKFIYGMPVVGNPDFSTGQETIEVQKTDGYATQRIGASGEAGDIFRAGQSPSVSFDYVVTGRSLVSASAMFFQAGCKEVDGGTDQYNLKSITLPDASDGSDPLYYGTFTRKMSTADPNGRALSDGVGTSFSLRASQTEPLQGSLGMNGRILLVNQDMDNYGSGAFTLDARKHYLLQDSVITINNSGSTHTGLAVSSFDINCSAEISANRYNTFFPLNLVLGNYTVEGSITIPALGKGTTTLGHRFFQTKLSQAGTVSSGYVPNQSAYFDPLLIKIGWVSGVSNVIGGAVTWSAPAADDDLLITLNAVITDVSLGGDVEADMTVSFKCMNQFTAGTDTIATDAIKIEYFDPVDTVDADKNSWGFEERV